MKLKVFILIICLIPMAIMAIAPKTTELIGIPTASVLGNGQLDVAGYFSTAIKFNEDNVPLSYNLAVSYGIMDMMDVTLHMYTYKEFALQFQYAIMQGNEVLPDISVGLKNITYRRYIDEGGGGDDPDLGYYDYSYSERSSDMFSLYFAFTKDFGAAGQYTVGLGRGEFIGYDRGKYLSTAALFDQAQLTDGSLTNEFMFGFFAGMQIPIVNDLSFVADVDGRDVNAGLRYATDLFSIDAALTHAELFTSNQDFQRPRVDLSFNYIFDFAQKAPQYGYLAINVIDNASNKRIPATISFEGIQTKPIYLKDGKVKLKLKPGKYTIKIDAAEYKWQKRILTIAPNATNEINVALSKKYDEKQKQHDQAIALAKDAKKKLNAGDINGAINKLEDAKKLAPNDPTVLAYWKEAQNKKTQMISTHRSNALSYEKKGWYKSARNEWNAILVLDKNNAEAKQKYSEMTSKLEAQNKPKETKPKETKPKADPEKLYNEGYQAFLDGNYKKAVERFEEVLKIDPGHKKADQYLKKAKMRL